MGDFSSSGGLGGFGGGAAPGQGMPMAGGASMSAPNPQAEKTTTQVSLPDKVRINVP